MRPFQGHHDLVGTGWSYRTHGIGVDMVRKKGKGLSTLTFRVLPENCLHARIGGDFVSSCGV